MNVNDIESSVLALPERDGLTPDDVCALLNDIDVAQRRLREAKKQLDAFLLDWLPQQPGGQIYVGDMRYRVGFESEVLNTDTAGTLGELFTATGGDLAQVGACLCSQPFKSSECVKVLPRPVYDRLFTRVEKRKAKHEPVKKVLAVNTKFLT